MSENKIMKKEQGKRLRESRDYFRFTQEQYGKKIGLNKTQVKDRETGISKISPSEAENIELKYGISAKWLITGQGSMLASPQTPTVAEPHAPYASRTDTPPTKSLLDLTARVLSTDSIFRTALESNVQAFHMAVELTEKVAVNETRLNQQQREIDELREKLAQLTTAGNSIKNVV